jgi:hypothetical protein
MRRFIRLLSAALLAAPVFSLVAEEAGYQRAERIRPPLALLYADSALPRTPAGRAVPERFRAPAEDSLFAAAAEIAWTYVDAHYHPSTGLTSSVISYPYATLWDIGSTLAAYHAAHELGLIDRADFMARAGRALGTLRNVTLFDDVAFNKNYQIAAGIPAGRNDRETAEGYGWSATDLGRLLVWLKIVATAHPELAVPAERVVDRLDFDRLIRDGYLRGEDLDRRGRRRAYQEGRLGYEQYAAAGFALWGHHADRALSTRENTRPVEVFDVPLLVDRRSGGHLTSEPFLLLGLELGWWAPGWRALADAVLVAQRDRYDATGQITIVSEDAIPLPPHYFYYYTVHEAGDDFAVVSLQASSPLDEPRWVSAKAAFGWYALRPGPYTWRALQVVQPAADPARGWGSGIYEGTSQPTGGQNINTAAVILEAALYHRLGRPILAAATEDADPGG